MDLYKKYNRLVQIEKKCRKDLKKHEKKLMIMRKALEKALQQKDVTAPAPERPLKPIPEKYLKKIKNE